MSEKVKIVVAGCGNMGSSHARAYHKLEGFDLVGLIDRSEEARGRLSEELDGVAHFPDLETALSATSPGAAAICTYPDTHAELARLCLDAGLHLFVEKPLAVTAEEAEALVQLANSKSRKIVVGYILRQSPAWAKFTEIAQTLGKPLVMRMNLNQQSKGTTWETHKNLMSSMSPIVDCGVHYVDVMCQMTRSRPVRVQAMGARLSHELPESMYNYGNLQVFFEDGSVGWYEAGWGPMMSETAFFVKDVVGPKGCVSIQDPQASGDTDSDNVDSHTQTHGLLYHRSDRDANGEFVYQDEVINTEDEPDHQGLCDREQAYFLKAILEDMDLTNHLQDAVSSLRIVLAADESVRTGKVVAL